VPDGPSRARISRLSRLSRLTASLGLGAAALVLWAGPAQAAACPTVDPSTGAVTPAPAPGVQWEGCDLAGANLSQSNLSNADLTSANLEVANLASADLTGADLNGADARNASLASASVGQADLTSALLGGSDLTDAQLTGTKLTDADLADATITGASLAGATLTGASGVGIKGSPASLPTDWSVVGGYLIGPGAGTYFTNADLNGLNLTGADFSGLNLLGATFQHANLTSANLTKANLTGVDFTSANLTQADLDGAKVSSTVWTGTVWSDTICPNGTNSDSYAHGRCYAPPPVSPFTATSLPLPAGAPANAFTPLAISCPTATQCSAGATYSNGQPEFYLGALLHWTGKQWTEIPAPMPSDKTTNRQRASVTSISCPSATRCLAGGYYDSLTGNPALLLSWSGKNWTAAKAPLPANAFANPDAIVSGMACPSVTSCFAVGQYSGRTSGGVNDEFGLLLRWSGGTWTAATAPAPAGSSQVTLSGVSCPSATLCFATGAYGNGGAQTQPLILRWSGGKWAVVKVSLPAGASAGPQVNMGGLSCPTTTHCVAVGSYLDTQGNQQGLLLTRSGTTWTAAKAPVPSGAPSQPWVNLRAVSCPTGSQCTVGGGYENTAAQPEGLMLLWSGGAWKTAPTPPGAYMVNGISCPTTTRCVAVSQNTRGPVALTGP